MTQAVIIFSALFVSYFALLGGVFLTRFIRLREPLSLQNELDGGINYQKCAHFLECCFIAPKNEIHALEYPCQITNLLSLSVLIHEYAHKVDYDRQKKPWKKNPRVVLLLLGAEVVWDLCFALVILAFYFRKQILSNPFVIGIVILLGLVYLFNFLLRKIKALCSETKAFLISKSVIDGLNLENGLGRKVRLVHSIKLMVDIFDPLICIFTVVVVCAAINTAIH